MELIKEHFPELDTLQVSKFKQLLPLYKDWNSKINIISRKDIDNLYQNHILHSLSIAKFISFKSDSKIMDMGTGGGFPGLPLAIMFPAVEFVLVDSVGKKLLVINDIASKLAINNIKTIHSRAESVNDKYDFVVSRAVTKLDEAWGWVSKNINDNNKNDIQNGLIYLKGGDISAEIPNNCYVQKITLTELINEPIFIDKALVYISKK
ncbi:MAG: 16S rRNA (guanine(527)-N(7))-methyltransferase RsmG [Patescibacteria group bacterium]|jgi:16S rRNA (guanine527-N7)-methyltransferase|nr:16S rRNA (guanine(527)-N(7))-methyltransferase RsmG [Patescibacteria group bacterium]